MKVDEQLTRNMAKLSAGLRAAVPEGDQWQVSVINVVPDDDSWAMVEMRFSRTVDGTKWNYREVISPQLLAASRIPPEDVGRFTAAKWERKASEALGR